MTYFRSIVSFCAAVCIVLIYSKQTIADGISSAAINQTITGTLLPVITLISGNRWIQGTLVILVTFVLASLTTWLLFKIIGGITRRTNFVLDDRIATLLRPPLYYTLVVFGITAGLDLMPLSDNVRLLTQRIFQTLNIIVWLIFLIRLCTLLLNRVAGLTYKYTFIQHRTVTLFDNLAKILIFGAGIYFVFVIWNIDMTAWLASAGIVGIAIGFAAKDSLSNLFSGVFIIADAPYKVGDYVVLENIGRGKVTNIGLRSTRILTRDDIEVTAPNSIIGNSTIINQSGGPNQKMRVRLKIGVAYGTDVDKVAHLLENVAKDEPMICKVPAPRVRFRLFGPSSLDFELLFWVENPEQRGRALDALNTKVYKMLNRENIEIPYTKQDIYIKGLPEQLAALSSDKGRNVNNQDIERDKI